MHAIACFGDSIVFGRGELPNIGWVGRLKNYHEKQDSLKWVYNLGIPGATSKTLLKRIKIELDALKPRGSPADKFSIIIGIGTNDTKADKDNKPQMPVSDFEDNIEKIIFISRKYSKNIVFVGLLPVDESRTLPIEDDKFYNNERLEQYNKVLKQTCRQEDISFIDLFHSWFKTDYKRLLKDGLHPNSDGYDLLFKDIKIFLLRNRILV